MSWWHLWSKNPCHGGNYGHRTYVMVALMVTEPLLEWHLWLQSPCYRRKFFWVRFQRPKAGGHPSEEVYDKEPTVEKGEITAGVTWPHGKGIWGQSTELQAGLCSHRAQSVCLSPDKQGLLAIHKRYKQSWNNKPQACLGFTWNNFCIYESLSLALANHPKLIQRSKHMHPG